MEADEITLFCGEQLSYLSSGQLPSPLHRVPPPSSSSGSSNGTTRYSMPFFARARPEALLTPMAAGAGAGAPPLPPVRCEDLILKQLFRRRPWRQQKVEGEEGVTPDY